MKHILRSLIVTSIVSLVVSTSHGAGSIQDVDSPNPDNKKPVENCYSRCIEEADQTQVNCRRIATRKRDDCVSNCATGKPAYCQSTSRWWLWHGEGGLGSLLGCRGEGKPDPDCPNDCREDYEKEMKICNSQSLYHSDITLCQIIKCSFGR